MGCGMIGFAFRKIVDLGALADVGTGFFEVLVLLVLLVLLVVIVWSLELLFSELITAFVSGSLVGGGDVIRCSGVFSSNTISLSINLLSASSYCASSKILVNEAFLLAFSLLFSF
jgi:hypothetical protein